MRAYTIKYLTRFLFYDKLQFLVVAGESILCLPKGRRKYLPPRPALSKVEGLVGGIWPCESVRLNCGG